MSANLEDRAWPQDCKRSILIPIPKKVSTKERSNHRTIALISHASKIVLKILHARHQHYLNQELPNHLTCLLRNLYGSQEVTEPCMEQLIGSGLRKKYDGTVCCHCLFNLYAEHIMRNAGLDELQAGIKIARRNINNLRCVDDTILIT